MTTMTNAEMISSTIADMNREREAAASSQVRALIQMLSHNQSVIRQEEEKLAKLKLDIAEKNTKLREQLAAVSWEPVNAADILGTPST